MSELNIDLSKHVDQQPSVAALLAEIAGLTPTLDAARTELAQAELTKKEYFARASQGGYGSLAEQDEERLLEHNIAIEAALRRLKKVQATLADKQYALDLERNRVKAAMASAVVREYGPAFAAMADLLEAVDVRLMALAESLGQVCAKFPAGSAPFSAQLLSGSNRQVAEKLRKVVKR